MHSRLFAVAASIILAASVRAQEPAFVERRYSLAQLVELALKSPLLSSQEARIEEKDLAARQARVWQGPSADVLLERGSRYELSAAQSLPLTGVPGLRGKFLSLESESLRVERAASEVMVALSVAQGAYEYSASRRKAAFAQSRRRRFELVESYLAGRVFATPQKLAESRIVSNQVKNLVAEAIRGEAAYKADLEKLKTFVPLDPGRYPEIEAPWLSGARGLEEKSLLDRALADNPELRARRLSVQGAGVERTLAGREGLPEASVVASYEKGEEDLVGREYGLGVSLTFPSWNANRSAVKSAEKRRLASERSLEHAERRLRSELARALVEYEAARQVVLKYPPETLSELEAQLKAADEGFRKGQVDLLTFLELDGSAAETYGRALDAQADLAAKAAELLALTADRDALAKLASF